MQLASLVAGCACAWAVTLALLPLAGAAAELTEPPPRPPVTAEDGRTACPLEPGPTRAVTAVIDGETVKLDDGSEVRLVGALSPRPPDSALDVSFWPPEREAKAALEQLVLGRSVTLAFSGRRTDRYGRTQAHLFVEPAAEASPGTAPAVTQERTWVQAEMLSRGHARAFVLKDSLGCLRELVAHEALARQAGAGLWAHAAYQIREAARTADLMRLRSTFQIIEGTVTKVIAGRSALILRFGIDDGAATTGATAAAADEEQRSPRDFSIAVKPAIARNWSADGITLDRIEGRRLRVRGWIERRGGPAIEILEPNQIELADRSTAVELTGAVAEQPPPRRRSRRANRAAAAALAPAAGAE